MLQSCFRIKMETMKKAIWLSYLSFILILNLPAQESNGRIILGTIDNLPPYSYYKEGELTGLDISVISKLFNEVERDIEIRPMPWARVLSELESGNIDGAFSFYYSADRESYALYLSPVHFDNLGILVNRGSEFQYRTMEDLYGKRIVKGRGVFISDDFSRAEKNGLIYVEEIQDTNMGNVRMLLMNRVDCSIGVAETMLYYADILGVRNDVSLISGLIEPMRPGYLVISRKSKLIEDTELHQKLTDVIGQYFEQGVIENIYRENGFEINRR